MLYDVWRLKAQGLSFGLDIDLGLKKKEVGVIKKDSNSKKKIGKQKISEGPVNQVRSLCSENVIGIVQLKRPLEINMSPS